MSPKPIFMGNQLDHTLSGVQLKYGISEISLIGFSYLMKIFSYLLGFTALIYLISVVVPYIENSSSYAVLKAVKEFSESSITFLKSQIPTKVGQYEFAIWIIIVVTLIIKSTFSRVSEKMKDKVYFVNFKRKYEAWKSEQKIKKGSALTSELDQKLYDLEHAKPKDREEILKQFIETKKKLDAMGRDLAFLSLDVVDSTKMKEGEEKAFVEHDFKEFKKFVDSVLYSNEVLKTAWTPDGVMCAFERVDQAVMAGRQVINQLDTFNKNVKAMKMDFSVRGGVNSGFVYFDENLPLEEIADRVIDIAGHFQKKAQPNTIWIAKPSIEPLGTRDGFQPTENVVDGYQVYEWKKE